MMKLFEPLKVGDITLPNRVVMAALTRVRAGPTHVPNDLMMQYYAQRASNGLIMTECTMVDAHACAFIGEPGIYSHTQVEGWRRITAAVHAKGGHIYLQIWHPGRAAHSLLNDGEQPVSSSAKAIRNDTTKTPQGTRPYETPRALRTEEIPQYVAMFRRAAVNAKAAGFDGVQLHGAHGYLIDNFLRDGVNERADAYGGSVANRARFLIEATDAVIEVFGAGRIGVRISPLVAFNDMSENQPEPLVAHVAEQLSQRRIAFLEVRHEDHRLPREQAILAIARRHFDGVLMTNGSYTRDSGEAALASSAADAIVFGRPCIANPDLVERFGRNAQLNAPDVDTFYGGGAKGYTDYPALARD